MALEAAGVSLMAQWQLFRISCDYGFFRAGEADNGGV